MRRPFFLAFLAAARCLAQDSVPAPRSKIQESTIHTKLRFQPVMLIPTDGSKPVAAELGRLTVLENRSRPDGATIELAFVRLRTSAARPGPPVVWLAGGPGGSGTEDAQGPLLPLLREIAEFADVIALDQRGMGLSRPRLECPGRLDLPLDRPMERNLVLGAFRQSASECRAHWSARGVDLASYNTNESARDVDDLRRALGVSKVSLLAGSYGTHLALAAIRLFEASIERAVLFGVSGPDHMERLPGDYQEVLEQIDRKVKRTPLLAAVIPTFLGTVRAVLERLERNPERVEGVDRTTGEVRTVTVGKFDLQCLTRNHLASREQIARLPGIYLAMARGDFRELANNSVSSRRGAAPPAVDFTMRCASGASPARREKVRLQSKDALLGGMADFPIPDVCDAWGVPDLGPDFRAPLRSNVPVLFVSGTLDAHTPPANAKEVLAGFPNGRHLLVEDGAHGLLGFSLPKGRKLSAKFLRGESVSAARLSTPPFGFFVPGLGRDAAIAAEFGRSMRTLPSYRSG
ncbi:MAG TPA: alpha/beta fold hydrolase, partial [Thermoanaerobaculia bacterium]|nr:alpha/beta fold hydrolase [Thermoanaerobaculia bacterium]